MSIPGRKPKPVEQRIREGTTGDAMRHKHKPTEVVTVGGRPEWEELKTPPEHLPDDAKEFWVWAVGRLVEVGIVDRVDVPVLEQMATQWARAQQAARVIEQQGMFVRGSVGQLREHPALRIEREAIGLFLKMAEHYALTPVARTRLGIAELHRRSMTKDLDEEIGEPDLKPA